MSISISIVIIMSHTANISSIAIVCPRLSEFLTKQHSMCQEPFEKGADWSQGTKWSSQTPQAALTCQQSSTFEVNLQKMMRDTGRCVSLTKTNYAPQWRLGLVQRIQPPFFATTSWGHSRSCNSIGWKMIYHPLSRIPTSLANLNHSASKPKRNTPTSYKQHIV